MKTLLKLAVLTAITASTAGLLSIISAPPASAQSSYRNMTCSQLWYARNNIYARNGQCFKTRRGRRTFGRNCFPPYGRISKWERRKVAKIKRWEAIYDCR